MLRKRKHYLSDFDWLVQNKRDFTVKKSRYSDIIKMDDSDAKPTMYSDSKTNNKIFHLLKKVKKELEPSITEVNQIMKGKKFFYNSINSNLGSFCSNEVSNVDINSAYLTVLNRDGLISNNLCTEINDLPKVDRLKILGLLAYEPDCFQFKNGKPFDNYSQDNDFKSIFFYAVNGVSEIMMQVSHVLRLDFIFFWVDGIYFFHRDFVYELVQEIIEDAGFKIHSDQLKNFVFDIEDEKKIKLTFENSQYATSKDEKDKKNFYLQTDFYRRKQLYGLSLKKYLRERTIESFKELLDYQKNI